MSKPVILLGAGGHAGVLLDALHLNGVEVLGYVAPKQAIEEIELKYLGDDEYVTKLSADEIELANSVGGLTLDRRECLYDDFKALGYRFAQVIHPSAVISDSATLGEGVQIMAGAVVQAGVSLADNVIINTRASVDHDCFVNRHCHVAAGAVLAGNIHVGEKTLIGAGATVIQGIAIGPDCIVGAGAVVISDVGASEKVVGVPARKL